MLSEKKKAIALIVSGLKGKGKDGEKAMPEEKGEGEYEEGEADEGLKAAAEDVMAAIESKDSAMLVSALRDFVSMC